ncbi:hypothetical protein Cadr_000031263 [Camelus dromedarius]|uniref:Uncharacterized protein n=1 Tax=Camelus dromedarius TaxID=9838 RepID=A0A5N4BXS4_CAMDR|nr:hypothetical protein Cadr_000031263 [Camelus dromedarius]
MNLSPSGLWFPVSLPLSFADHSLSTHVTPSPCGTWCGWQPGAPGARFPGPHLTPCRGDLCSHRPPVRAPDQLCLPGSAPGTDLSTLTEGDTPGHQGSQHPHQRPWGGQTG